MSTCTVACSKQGRFRAQKSALQVEPQVESPPQSTRYACCTWSCRHDLDLLVDLQTQHFEKDRMQCLDRIRSALCSKPVPGGVVEAASLGHVSGSTETNPFFATGWTVRHECTYLHLCHPTLNINLDIQVRNRTGTHLHCCNAPCDSNGPL